MTMIDLATRRRVFAEEIEACCGLETRALVEALATVPREAFLQPGPWLFRGEGDVGGPPRRTPDADPRHVYHNVSVGIDPARQLFNGAPSALALAIDALELQPGSRVLHVGCGFGYYTAIIAHIVGSAGHVVAVDVDETLAKRAAQNVASLAWVNVRHGNGAEPATETFDAILINAGVTHPREEWLSSLPVGGRLVLPLTVTMPTMGTIGKGLMLRLKKGGDEGLDVRTLSPVAIYSAIGLRDETTNAALGRALQRAPFVALKRLRRDPHDEGASCWLHTTAFCFSTA